mmetsp:Transcript_23987/g.73462  ORF Transcript_23987/g.73462 Transcript_23987/m.73462 type:complete len:217 (+) Transcript_23987:1121-1771(+)
MPWTNSPRPSPTSACLSGLCWSRSPPLVTATCRQTDIWGRSLPRWPCSAASSFSPCLLPLSATTSPWHGRSEQRCVSCCRSSASALTGTSRWREFRSSLRTLIPTIRATWTISSFVHFARAWGWSTLPRRRADSSILQMRGVLAALRFLSFATSSFQSWTSSGCTSVASSPSASVRLSALSVGNPSSAGPCPRALATMARLRCAGRASMCTSNPSR